MSSSPAPDPDASARAPQATGGPSADRPGSGEAAAPVPIVGGTGALGFGLALRLTGAGVPVVIGSRRPEAAAEAADRVRAQVPGATVEGALNAEAAPRGPVIVLSVPFRAQSENLTNLKQALRPGQVLLDATVPLAAAVSGRATRLLGVPQGSAAEQAREMAPEGVRVVSGLHTVSAALLADLGHDLDEDVLLAGDDRDSKRLVARLLAAVPGLRPVDCGRLEVARLIEGLTPLLISVNSRHKARAGVRLTGLPADTW